MLTSTSSGKRRTNETCFVSQPLVKEVRGLADHSLRVRDEITGDVVWPILSGENVIGLLKVYEAYQGERRT